MLVIHNQVLIYTAVLILAFLCLKGKAITKEYLNAPLVTYHQSFGPVYFKIFFRVHKKTCRGVKRMQDRLIVSDSLDSALNLHVRDLIWGWTAILSQGRSVRRGSRWSDVLIEIYWSWNVERAVARKVRREAYM